MAIDIRARVTCNLGPLISASISDSYIQGAGIITTTGTCLLDGCIEVTPGAPVEFFYERPTESGLFDNPIKVPRGVQVVNYFVDPIRRTTQVELACALALAQNDRDDIAYKPPGPSLDECYDIATVQIEAESVLLYCVGAIGCSTLGAKLSNKFSQKEFDLSAGYVQVINDLVISENKYGYVNPDIVGDILFLPNIPSGSVNLIDQANLIDISPIGVGTFPPARLEVDYSSLKLKDGDIPADLEDLSWEKEETIGNPQSVTITYTDGNSTDSRQFRYTPYQITLTTYDSWDRKVKSVTTDYTIRAVVASAYVQAELEYANNYNGTNGIIRTGSTGSFQEVTITTTEIFYKIPADILPPGACSFGITPPPGYEEVDREVVTVKSPTIAIASQVAPGFFNDDNSLISLPGGNTVSAITTTTTQQQFRQVKVRGSENEDGEYETIYLGSYPVTKTLTHYRKAYAETQAGQQDIAMRVEQGQKVTDFLSTALNLVDDGVETRIVTGREAAVQIRPPLDQRIFNYYSNTDDGVDLENGYKSQSTTGTEVVSGADGAGTLKLSLPYAPDDAFVRIGVPPEVTYRSLPPYPPASVIASRFGYTQLRLITGNRYGMNIQVSPENLPKPPIALISVSFGGVTNSYLTNGTTYTMDANGIVASSDLIALGVIGKSYAQAPKTLPSGSTTVLPFAPVSLIGSVSTITGDPQTVLDNAFPDAEPLDGIKVFSTGDYWVYDGTDWIFRGPFPGAVKINVAPTSSLGTIATVGLSPQTALNAAYPAAPAGAGVQALDTTTFWVYDGTTWYDRGQNPGYVIEYVSGSSVPLYDVRIDTKSVVRSRVVVSKFEYALDLLTLASSTVKNKVVIQKVVIGSTGIFSLAGQPALFTSNRVLGAAAGAFALAGQDALFSPAILSGEAGEFTVSGQNAGLIKDIGIRTGTQAPLLGATSAVSFTGWTRIQNASVDDGSIAVSGWPFTFTLAGTGYTEAFVGSNTYITFGAGSSDYNGLGAGTPNLPKILFGSGDNSYQRVYTKADIAEDGSNVMRIRYEGQAATSGTPGSSNIIAEFAFYAARPNGDQWIELRVGLHNRTSGPFMIASASANYASATITANSSWVFVGNSTGTVWTLTSNRYIA